MMKTVNTVAYKIKLKLLHSTPISNYNQHKGNNMKFNDLLEQRDEDAIRELTLYAENDGDLHSKFTSPIQKNLAKKFKAGKFDVKLAAKAFMRLTDAASKKYKQEFGSDFDKATRMEAAMDIAKEFEDELKLGNF